MMKTGLKSLVAAVLMAASATGLLAQNAMTNGEVRKVDKDNKKITLKHEDIKNLDMPAMTMVFTVKDEALLDKVQPGDKVQFRAENEGGKISVTEIQPAK